MDEVVESVEIDFKPWSLALTSTRELLITCQDSSPVIRRLSEDRRVSSFADISPYKAWNIAVSENGEVLVGINKLAFQLVLIHCMSGDIIRHLSLEVGTGCRIACLAENSMAFTTGSHFICRSLLFVNKSNQVTNVWNGELENGQKLSEASNASISRDKHGRIFVPDYCTNQIYVLTGRDKIAKPLLDNSHEVTHPISVCASECGHIWIGCIDGTIHVIQI
ncbi:uncharacterized protein LOC117318963 [Pecten maximus]|uniref:uncharacterized protein LOC117318963 n=1 Tax=Pecten maximus TaxID=6579 RepID=UPI0014589644|nr:uncharacterized protein LOC117318963 [Pecten maximus]